MNGVWSISLLPGGSMPGQVLFVDEKDGSDAVDRQHGFLPSPSFLKPFPWKRQVNQTFHPFSSFFHMLTGGTTIPPKCSRDIHIDL